MSFFFLCLAGVAVFLIWHHRHWQVLPWPERALQVPPFQAHRGAHQIEQENTLAAFRAASLLGAEMIELDVRLSRDQIAVVFHDPDLQRIAGQKDLVKDLSAQELKDKARVPRLEEVLNDPQSPPLVNIEIKSSSFWQRGLEQAVAQVILDTQSTHRVLISSFNPLSLYRMSCLLPQVPRALLATGEEDPENKIYLKKLWLAPYVRIHALHLDYRFVTSAELKKFRDRQIPVAFWTVNNPVIAQQLLHQDCLSLISDLAPADLELPAGIATEHSSFS